MTRDCSTGLIYFCLNDKLALRALVDGLRIPSLQTRVSRISFRKTLTNLILSTLQEIILDMFFDLLNIKPPDWHKAFIDGRRLTSKDFIILNDQLNSHCLL